MGIFSDSVKTYVSSSVYNLAGDEDLRPQYLKTVLLGSVLAGNRSGLGMALVSGLLGGSGMNQRKFFRWARDNYALGMPIGSTESSASVDGATVVSGLTPLLGLASNQSVQLLSASVDPADVDYWARHWIHTNRPTLTDDNWTADYNAASSAIMIEMTPLGTGTAIEYVSLEAPADFLWGIVKTIFGLAPRRVLFVLYNVVTTLPNGAGTTIGASQLFTYRMGSGNVIFDAMQQTPLDRYEFFPALPLRLDNKSIRHADLTTTFDAVKPAFKKMTGSSVDDLLDQIEENTSIGDIDFCFLVHGVSINSKENEAKRYLYKFFANLISVQQSGKVAFNASKPAQLSALQMVISTTRWLGNNTPAVVSDPIASQLSGGTMPASTGTVPLTTSEVRVYSGKTPQYDQRITWNYIDETLGYGNGKTFDGNQSRGTLKVGDLWFFVAPSLNIPGVLDTNYRADGDHGRTQSYRYISAPYSIERIYLFHQRSQFAYSRLEIVGMQHVNQVYNGKSVITSISQALALTDEESGFLVPLHYPSLSDMGLLRSTQLATANTYLVFNSYQVVRKKWWQKGIFRILLIIAMAIITVIVPPLGGMAAGGILGTNLAIGAAMGFGTAMGAAIAGAIANALASMILTTLIQVGATKLFGEKFGAIIGTIASFMAMNYATSYAQTGTFNVDWGSMLRAENLMKITNSVTGAYTAWIQGDTKGIYEDIAGLDGDYKDRFDAVEDATKEMLGSTPSLIDPMMLTDVLSQFSETSDEFVTRTTLTGDEIAELSQIMIYEFAQISLELPSLGA